jgi:energy-coupling factor transport system ATP-binding protein
MLENETYMVECNEVVYKYKADEGQEPKIAVNGVNLIVKKGEFIVVLRTKWVGKINPWQNI